MRGLYSKGTVVALVAAPVVGLLAVLAGARTEVLLSGPWTGTAVGFLIATVAAVAAISAALALLGYAETSDQRVLLMAAAFVVFASIMGVASRQPPGETGIQVLGSVARAVLAAIIFMAVVVEAGPRRPVPPRRMVAVTLAMISAALLLVVSAAAYPDAAGQFFGQAPESYGTAWAWAALGLGGLAAASTWRAFSRSGAPVLQHVAIGMTILTEAAVIFVMNPATQTTLWWLGWGVVTVSALAMGGGLLRMYAGVYPPSSIYDLEVMPVVVDAAVSSGETVMLVDSRGMVVSTSKNTLSPFRDVRVVGKHLSKLPEGEVWVEVWKGGEPAKITITIGNERRTLRVTPTALPSPPGGTVVLIRDSTIELQQREQAERLSKELEQSRAELEQSREALKRRAESLEEAYLDVVRGLGAFAAALARRDRYDTAHHRRLAHMAGQVAIQVGMSGAAFRQVRDAAMLYDIGKVVVPERVLALESGLTEDEWNQLREVPVVGEKILGQIGFLRGAGKLVRHVHERFDGAGYPDGLAGEDIPMGSRVIAVTATFLAMTSDRPYRPAIDEHAAQDEIRRGTGTMYCPKAAAALFEIVASKSESPHDGPAVDGRADGAKQRYRTPTG